MNIALIGYGKMGRMIEEIARSRGHNIVCIIDINNQDDFESDAFRSAEVAIEFTTPTAAFGNFQRAFAHGVKVVSGSTGWQSNHAEEVQQLIAEGNTLFWASNFSVGVAIFNAVNRYLATLMNNYPQYDVTLTETHHIHKLDAPSGTAITTAKDIVERLDRKQTWQLGTTLLPDGKMLGESTVPSDHLRIDAIRLGETPGTHTVRYDSQEDEISLTHNAHSRRGFAFGAVLAAEFTATHSGLLTMNDLFPL